MNPTITAFHVRAYQQERLLEAAQRRLVAHARAAERQAGGPIGLVAATRRQLATLLWDPQPAGS